MIELGKLRIETETSIVDARNKVAHLSEALAIDEIAVTRIATALSQMARVALRDSEYFYLSVGLVQRERVYGILLVFEGLHDSKLIDLATPFFDKVSVHSNTEGTESLHVFRSGNMPDFVPSDGFIERARNKIQQLSKADQLLRVILPGSIAEELTAKADVKTRRHENVAVLFADIVGFTTFCDKREPEEVVDHLQELSLLFESIAEKYRVEKIKTVGDCFMATAGLLVPLENPVLNCILCGQEMLLHARRMSFRWNLRIGVHIGPVTAGIVGHKRFSYDLWGDTVNTAARIEANGEVGSVNLSPRAMQEVDTLVDCASIGVVAVKGKGDMEIFRVIEVHEPQQEGLRSNFA